MMCPTCTEIDLLLSERQGIEIDYCPKCRGVWLDRGELDKFIQQSERQSPSRANAGERTETKHENFGSESSGHRESKTYAPFDQHRRTDDDAERGYRKGGKKKESFWGELFDFG